MRLWNRLRLRARMGPVETELTDEIRLHRELLEEEFVREGMSRGEAARAAALQFGNASAATDLSREEWSFPRFDAVWKDLGFALRLMRRQPLVTAVAVLTVAFGVGANTAVFSVIETVLLNPLGMLNRFGEFALFGCKSAPFGRGSVTRTLIREGLLSRDQRKRWP